MKKYMNTAAFLAVLLALAICAGTASAAATGSTGGQNCVTASNGVQYCNQQSQISIQQSDQKVEMLSAASSGVLQVRWAFPGGWRPKTQKGCHWVTGGTNSYYDSAGRLIKINWTGKRAYICPSKTSPSGWRKAGGPPHWEPCGNIFWPLTVKQPMDIFRGKYRVVQHFNYTAKLTLKLTLNGNVSATASCSVSGASASGTATGVDVESITVKGTATGSTMAQAIGKARTVAIDSTEVNNLKATVTAKASYKMQASASASCEAPPPAPPVPTPTPTPPAPPVQPVQYSCTLTVPNASKSDPYTAYASVTTSGPVQTVLYTWDGPSTTSSSSSTNASHTYPTPPVSQNAGDGTTYHISAQVFYTNGTNSVCNPQSVPFFVADQAPLPPPTKH